MSARAASRLVSLGFANVLRYQAGKADWFAAGLPREGKEAHIPRVGDIAKRDVATCRLDERVADVRDRMDGESLVVVDADRVVLGLVGRDALNGDPAMPIEQVMDSAPVTFRPNVRAGEVPDYFKKQGVPRAIVTTSDGVLIGLIRLSNALDPHETKGK
jgi:Mg/Co/Ni transporter MgtE